MAKYSTDGRSISERLAALSTSILSDATGGVGVLAPGLVRYSGSGTIAGRARTADCAEGSVQAIFAALEDAQAGDILIVKAPGKSAYLGDMLATNLLHLGLAGAIIDGFVRDRATISSMPISFFGRGVYPVNLRRREPGVAMKPISVGEVEVAVGDWIVADDDGVLVLRPDQVEAAIAKALVGEQIEKQIREYLRNGLAMEEAISHAVKDVTG
ncbi:MAG: RraA family protein [Sphingomonadaceae bacterium]